VVCYRIADPRAARLRRMQVSAEPDSPWLSSGGALLSGEIASNGASHIP
jgi:hypothetical protein